MKRKLTTWEKMFTNHISNKGLVSRIHKEDPNLAEKKINQKIVKRHEGTFHKKYVDIITQLIILNKKKSVTTANTGKDEKLDHTFIAVEKENSAGIVKKSGSFLKN